MSSRAPSFEELPESRQIILTLIKRRGAMSIAELAETIHVSYEAVRQHLNQITREGWVERRIERAPGSGPGRPRARFQLTVAGEHLFPKHYDALSVELIDAVLARFGVTGLRQLLEDLTDARVARWQPELEGLEDEDRLQALRGLYLAEDPFMEVSRSADGELRLIERNCPFFNVARQRPALCSLSVSTLSRLLGYKVVREERFQAGDGRCVFRVDRQRPVDPQAFRFEFEEPAAGSNGNGTPS